ncbi:hypothetical protein EDB83DRAFT_2675432 [Lactarius deliciosus]|nr:hypothetical protein EDB83DRAFT_2675432 [Lactarius deliciosus]
MSIPASPTRRATKPRCTILAPLNVQYYVAIIAPKTPAVGAGGGPAFVALGPDASFTTASAPAPANPTTQGKTLPWLYPRRRVIVS